jgi:hypothetical protein
VIDYALSRPLGIESLTKNEVEDVFVTNYGDQFKRITLRVRDRESINFSVRRLMPAIKPKIVWKN